MEIVEKVIDRMITGNDRNWAMNIEAFDWVPGVGLYGIYQAYQATGKKEYLDFLIRWTEEHGVQAYKQKSVNATAPLLTILELYKVTGNQAYGKLCMDLAEYILIQAPRTSDGALEHTVTEGAVFKEQMWADTLFMTVIFIAGMGALTGRQDFADFAAGQLLLHHRYLRDARTGLYYHGWDSQKESHLSGILWGRANAWILYSTVEILHILPEFQGRDEVMGYLRSQVLGVERVQRPDGLFGTILDDGASYSEISASAGIVSGIKRGISYGYLDAELGRIVRKACKTLPAYINESGEVLQVSGGTPILEDAAAYRNVAVMPTLYGQTFMCMAFI